MKCKNCKFLGYGYTMEDTLCTYDSEPIKDIDEELIDCVVYEVEEDEREVIKNGI